MAGTFTVVPNSENVVGKHRTICLDLAVTTYATGGYKPVPPFGKIMGGRWLGGNTAHVGYVAVWNTQTSKWMILRSAGFTPAGTVAAPTIDGSAAKVTLVGGQAGGVAIQITPDTSSAVLGKTTATNFNAAAPITGVTASAPAFTGTAVAAGALVEVSNGVSVAATFRLELTGY